MRQPPPSHPIPDTAALPEAPCEDALVARQVRLLGGISMAGTRMTQRMWRQANEAKYLGAEGALMFARIARAVRQTIAMERRLGAHAEADSKQQQVSKSFLISLIGTIPQSARTVLVAAPPHPVLSAPPGRRGDAARAMRRDPRRWVNADGGAAAAGRAGGGEGAAAARAADPDRNGAAGEGREAGRPVCARGVR